MLPGYDEKVATRRRWHWFKPIRCSICTGFIWLRPIAFSEPVGAPEPRQQWVLCKPCHTKLLLEMRRSSLPSSVRLRVSIGLVAAERSPYAYHMREQMAFQREFAWFVRFLVLFALLHLVIFVILFAIPR
jgi:hypothetical protein